MLILTQSLGGLGLFLLGMVTMTDNLRSLAGERMRAALMRFTRTPASGALSGAVCTAMLQSSSATTVAVVGFVGAELMSFSNALGVIFGANIGSTATGWIVALLGFKLKLQIAVLPLIFIGVLMRLFSQGQRAPRWGLAMAGFGLIFVGIGLMQESMAGLQGIVSFQSLPADSLLGRLKLVGLGIAFTLITQASSAGVAATLTALYAGMVSFPQATSLVIGMDVGTTVTALMASLGGSVGMRRTGLSHVIYNLLTAIMALLLIDPYIALWQWLSAGHLLDHAEVALVAFHTSFNTLGVLLILPFAIPFARLICRLVPEPVEFSTAQLDSQLKAQPPLALTAAHHQCVLQLQALLHHGLQELGRPPSQPLISLPRLQQQLDQTQAFLDDIHLQPAQQPDWQRLIALLHCLDHQQRLHERLDEDQHRASVLAKAKFFASEREKLKQTLNQLLLLLQQQEWSKAYNLALQQQQDIETKHEALRQQVIDLVGQGDLTTREGTEMLESLRWLRRVSTHLARISYHLQLAVTRSGI